MNVGIRARGVVAGVVLGAASIVAVGCGSSAGHSAAGRAAANGTVQSKRWDPSSGPPHCDPLPVGAYRTCIFDGPPLPGQPAPIAQRGQGMKADNLTAKIERVTTSRLSPGPGAFGLGRARANGTFIIVSMAVTSSDINPTGPQGDAFYEQKDGMVELLAGHTTLWPSGKAENADYDSFLNGKYVKPGETVTGDVIFDVPTDQVQDIIRNDAIAVSGFGLSIGSGAFGLLKLT